MTNIKKTMVKTLRYPRLDTVLMVEKFIKKYDGEYAKKKLWEKLPKKMMYQTFCLIFDYLLYSRKISIDVEGKIGWIFYPPEVYERIKHKHLFYSEIEMQIKKDLGIKKLQQKEAILELAYIKGKSNKKISNQEYELARKKAFEELESEIR